MLDVGDPFDYYCIAEWLCCVSVDDFALIVASVITCVLLICRDCPFHVMLVGCYLLLICHGSDIYRLLSYIWQTRWLAVMEVMVAAGIVTEVYSAQAGIWC